MRQRRRSQWTMRRRRTESVIGAMYIWLWAQPETGREAHPVRAGPAQLCAQACRASGDASGRKAHLDSIATHDLAETAMKASAGLCTRAPPSRCAPSSFLACFALRGTGARGGVYAHPGPGPSGMGRSAPSEPYASLSDAWRSTEASINNSTSINSKTLGVYCIAVPNGTLMGASWIVGLRTTIQVLPLLGLSAVLE